MLCYTVHFRRLSALNKIYLVFQQSVYMRSFAAWMLTIYKIAVVLSDHTTFDDWLMQT